MALAATATADGVTVTIAARRVERDLYEWDAHIEIPMGRAISLQGGCRAAMIAGFTAALDKMIEQNEERHRR